MYYFVGGKPSLFPMNKVGGPERTTRTCLEISRVAIAVEKLPRRQRRKKMLRVD